MCSGKKITFIYICELKFFFSNFRHKILLLRKNVYITNYNTTFKIQNMGFDKNDSLKFLYWKKLQMPHIIQIFKKHQLSNHEMSSRMVVKAFYSSTDAAGCLGQHRVCCHWGGEVCGR